MMPLHHTSYCSQLMKQTVFVWLCTEEFSSWLSWMYGRLKKCNTKEDYIKGCFIYFYIIYVSLTQRGEGLLASLVMTCMIQIQYLYIIKCSA